MGLSEEKDASRSTDIHSIFTNFPMTILGVPFAQGPIAFRLNMKNFGKKLGSPMLGFTLTEKTSISSIPIFPSPGALVAGDRVCQGRRNFSAMPVCLDGIIKKVKYWTILDIYYVLPSGKLT